MCVDYTLPTTHTAQRFILALTHDLVYVSTNYYTVIVGVTAALQFYLAAGDYISIKWEYLIYVCFSTLFFAQCIQVHITFVKDAHT